MALTSRNAGQGHVTLEAPRRRSTRLRHVSLAAPSNWQQFHEGASGCGLTARSNICSTCFVGMTASEARYMAGYEVGRSRCLASGSASSVWRWLSEQSGLDPAFVAGVEWAIWDYEDANGLRSTDSSVARGAAL